MSRSRNLRRKGLAALVVTCSVFASASQADEGANKSNMTLRPLPPLPVGIGQLREVTPKTAPPPGVKSNPYAVPKSEQVLKRVGGELPAESVPKPASSRAMLVQSPNPTFQRIVAQQAPTFLMPATESNFDAPASKPRENPWVTTSSATGPRGSSDAPFEATSAPNEVDIPADTTGVDSEPVDPAHHFNLSDQQSPDDSPLEFRLKDNDEPRSAAVAPLLQVAPPVLLQAATPVLIEAEHSSVEAADGDARSFAELNRYVKSRLGTVDVDTAPPDEPSVGVNVVTASAPIVLESPDPSDLVADASEAKAAPVPTPPVAETTRIQPPVPQVYRPQQSLVIDVPVAQVAAISVSQDDWEGTNSTRDPIFCGEVAQIMTLSTAQTLAHTPDEPVRRVQLENRDVCEAVLVGTHKLLLIGRATGSTRMAIWSGEAPDAKLYEIQVAAQTDATPGSSLDAISKRLTETISATYPNCRVQVVTHGDGLAVIGKAGNSKSAREIMRLVRSACLKSVSDHLEVR